MHPFDGWHTMEGRHLVFAYAAVALLQLGYAAWMAIEWRKVAVPSNPAQKKATKPV